MVSGRLEAGALASRSLAHKPVTVVGIGADGCASLTSRAFNAIARAQVLAGGRRQLGFFPEFAGEIVTLEGNLAAAVDHVAERADEHDVVVLASGDPLFFGIGGLLVRRLGMASVEVIPQVSSVQWAFARAGLPWQEATVVSLHGRPLRGLVSRLRRSRCAAILTCADNTPARIAAHLIAYGDEDWNAWLCEDLGGSGERVRAMALAELARVGDESPLNVIVLARGDAGWRPPPPLPALDENYFARKVPLRGLITKREVRAVALGALRLRPDAVVWDVGAGSGAVAIEASYLASEGQVFAVEVDPVCAEHCRSNVWALGADNVEVVEGRAPEALEALPAPDAVFVGGSKGRFDDIAGLALARLRPGGRLVATAVTLDSVAEIYRYLRARGHEPETTLLQVSRGAPLARYQRYQALNPIHVFATSRAQEPR